MRESIKVRKNKFNFQLNFENELPQDSTLGSLGNYLKVSTYKLRHNFALTSVRAKTI